MSKEAVDRILGAPTYSPVDGQYYYPTDGDCPMPNDEPEGPRTAPCGVVAEFRVTDYSVDEDPPRTTVTGILESCWWGGIGE